MPLCEARVLDGHMSPDNGAMRDSGGQVSRRLVNITLDNLDDLPPRCRGCVFWELDPIGAARAADAGEPGLEKESQKRRVAKVLKRLTR